MKGKRKIPHVLTLCAWKASTHRYSQPSQSSSAACPGQVGDNRPRVIRIRSVFLRQRNFACAHCWDGAKCDPRTVAAACRTVRLYHIYCAVLQRHERILSLYCMHVQNLVRRANNCQQVYATAAVLTTKRNISRPLKSSLTARNMDPVNTCDDTWSSLVLRWHLLQRAIM